jgi:hypothetical protein
MWTSRRHFLKGVVAVGAAASGASLQGQPANRVSGFDHVAVPMQNTDAMVAFYRRLGFQMTENENAVSVYIGDADDQLPPAHSLAGSVVHLARARREASMWRLLLRVGGTAAAR